GARRRDEGEEATAARGRVREECKEGHGHSARGAAGRNKVHRPSPLERTVQGYEGYSRVTELGADPPAGRQARGCASTGIGVLRMMRSLPKATTRPPTTVRGASTKPRDKVAAWLDTVE
ncbi:hypothetical protein THAOC_30005, partial [Thalassiosira oceanica]